MVAAVFREPDVAIGTRGNAEGRAAGGRDRILGETPASRDLGDFVGAVLGKPEVPIDSGGYVLRPAGSGWDDVFRDGAPFSTFDFLRADDVESRQKEAEVLEREASVVRVFQPHVVPGILQTDEFARSVIRLAGQDNREAIERGMRARRARRSALKQNKEFRFVITEGALRTRVCSNACMIKQIEHVQRLARRKNISLSVLPWSARPSALILSSFYVFDERAVYIELTHGELKVCGAADIQLYLKRFSDFERAGLSGVDAIAALGRILQDFRRLEDVEQGSSPTVV